MNNLIEEDYSKYSSTPNESLSDIKLKTKSTEWQATLNFLKSFIGTNILTLPYMM